MKRQIYLVICGAVREPVELSLVLAEFLDLRSQGLIDKIRISTWIGEFDRYQDFKNNLIDHGIEIVESAQASEGGLANTWRQYLAFDQGVLDLDDETLIVKARTDKMSTYLPWIRLALQTKLHLFEGNQEKLKVFERKVLVPYFSLSMPFLIKDVSFIGLKKDLKKFCHFEYWSQICSASSVTPEGRWKAFPFFTEFPIFKELFKQADMFKFSTWVIDNCKNIRFPSSLIKLYALYFTIISNSFEAFYSDKTVEKESSFSEIMSGQIGKPVEVERADWNYCYTSSNSVFNSITGTNTLGPNDYEFFQEFSKKDRILSTEYQRTINIDEIAAFFSSHNSRIFDSSRATRIINATSPASSSCKSAIENFESLLVSLKLDPRLLKSLTTLVDRDPAQGDFLTSLLLIIDQAINTGNIQDAKSLADFTFNLPEAQEGARPLNFLLTRLPRLNGRQELFPSIPELYNQRIDSDVFILALLTLWKNSFGEDQLLKFVHNTEICPNSIRKGVAKIINPS
jgi:hypothetical protein